MSDALSRCTQEIISIKTTHGTKPIAAMRFGDFACHDGYGVDLDRVVVTHLPTGLCLNSRGTFDTEEQAAAAMERIAVECDWSGDWSPNGDRPRAQLQKLGQELDRIFAECGAVRG